MRILRRAVCEHLDVAATLWDGVWETAAPCYGAPPHPTTVYSSSTQRDDGPFQYTPLTSTSNLRILHLKRVFRDGGMEETRMPLCESLIEASIEAPPE